MSLWPKATAMRLVAALVLGMVGVVILSLLVGQFDAAPKRTNRAQASSQSPRRSRADGGREDASSVAAKPSSSTMASRPVAPRPAAPRSIVGLGLRLRPLAGTILLARTVSAMPPDVAPVIEVLANGEFVLRRPPPLAQGPGLATDPSSAGHGAGIVLPAPDLAGLTGSARAGLLRLLRHWVEERPVAPERLAASGIAMSNEVLRRLLSWVP